MRTRFAFAACLLFPLLLATAHAQPPLTVVNGRPTGETSDLGESREVTIVFSEPMVVLGRIPTPVAVPFFRIEPALRGTFRWTAPHVLVFAPDPKVALPFATRYTVTIDGSATATSGRRLGVPYTFSFTTPTVRLLATNWYRRNGRFDDPVVVGFRFNQPVRPRDLLAHLRLTYAPHEWTRPTLSAAARARLTRMDPAGLAAFEAKLARADAAASSRAPLAARLVETWDTRRLGAAAPTLVVMETTTVPPVESWMAVDVPAGMPGVQGSVASPRPQTYTMELEPTFFATGVTCASGCAPDTSNSMRLRRDVLTVEMRRAFSAVDATTGQDRSILPKTAEPPRRYFDRARGFTLEDLGYERQPPVSRYVYRLDPSLRAIDGQTLGYPWVEIVENWHERAFTSFGDGHGVWEATGGTVLPFYARNLATIRQWVAAVTPRALMPTILALQKARFTSIPDATPAERSLPVQPDRIQSHGLDLAPVLTGGRGLVWAALEEGRPIPRAEAYRHERTRATIVQVTNLGLTVKDSPQNTLVFVTRLDNAAPVEGAAVSIVTLANEVAWTGRTNADGVAIAPALPLRPVRRWYETRLDFLVIAEKDGDTAYLGSDWTEGVSPWEFGIGYDRAEQQSLLRGSVFADRGVYRLGEEVHFKAILRHDTPKGIAVPDAGTPVHVSVRDSHGREVDRRTVTLSAWGSAEWTETLPAEGALGHYSVHLRLRPFDEAPPRPSTELVRELGVEGEVEAEAGPEPRDSVHGGFLVAAYRRPDFRVDATLTTATPFAGTTLTGQVTARYLFGAAMKDAPVRWTYSRWPAYGAPASLRAGFPHAGYAFGVSPKVQGSVELRADEDAIGEDGSFEVELETTAGDGVRYEYQIEGEVTDVSRQRIANRASIGLHPAAVYIGVQVPYFADQKAGVTASLVALSPDGEPVPETDIAVTVQHVQWISARRAEGSGFYTWDTQEKVTEVGTFTTRSAREPVALAIPLKEGGYFRLRAQARDAEGRLAATETAFYAMGPGYTAWTRFDHHRIELVPERRSYKPGELARILIKSPWEQATALVTTEREGIRSHRRFALESSQQAITVPIAEADIPNVYVSVLLVKGRSQDATPDDGSDPGKPSFRLGYVQLEVEDDSKRLAVTARADKEEFRPANTARVAVVVKDHAGRPAVSEVTLWAVDYGVLSLTAFRTPDVLRSVYVHKALQVMTTDSRQRIVSRRVLTPKGGDEGGGGGEAAGAGTMRKDFRVLAFWVGSVVTDARGQATVEVTLPESLTTYRIMAVAADKASRFGSAESEIRVNKPLTMKPAFPRFLTRGDTASFGAVVTSQLRAKGTATVTMKSLDPAVLQLTGPATRTVAIGPGSSAEVRFEATAKAIGRARIQMTARMGSESDAFEDAFPVEVLVSPETVAAYGDTTTEARERLEVPAGVVPGFGGLSMELASTAMVGLGEGARYVIEYPYGCAEQRSSRALALMLAADLGQAFALPDIDPKQLRTISQAQVTKLEQYQCPSGGFAYWPGACLTTSPYLTSYVLHVFTVAESLNYRVDPEVKARAYAYLERELAMTPPENESWYPAYTAWQAFAVKVLVEGGRNQDSNLTRLYEYLDRMPVFALAYLADALVAKGESGPRLAELHRRMANAVLPEGGSAHVEELDDPYLLWFWNSNVRSTAIVLGHLARQATPETDLRAMVRWMMAAREDGRWGNTQENALAMEALVTYYRTHEAEVPDFAATVALGGSSLATQTFKGRSAAATTKEVPMRALLASGPAGTTRELTFSKRGSGRLFYAARLKYAVDVPRHEGLDSGFAVTRTYAPADVGARGPTGPAATSYKAGDLVRVTLTFHLTKERRYVAVVDPLPAGFEPVESWFATTARDLAGQTDDQSEPAEWWALWAKGGFDHVEKLDDQVRLYATRLAEGRHEFSYIVRATTAGRFVVAPARAEEMYEPEVFGRTPSVTIDVKP